MKRIPISSLVLVACLFAGSICNAEIPNRMQVQVVDSGLHDGGSSGSAFKTVIRSPGATWMRLYFEAYDLGTASTLTITSLQDGAHQTHTMRTLTQWRGSTAFMNGDAVKISLDVAAEDRGVFFRLGVIRAGDPDSPRGDLPLDPTTICGTTDDRTLSSDARVARITYVSGGGNPQGQCTAWLTHIGVLLTAGHCADLDPAGPALPDGNLDMDNNDVVEFNPPPSTSSGRMQFAPPSDQYLIDLSSVVWEFDGSSGLGKDWAHFKVFRNTNTGLTPFEAQGLFFRLEKVVPSNGAALRITGHGSDVTPDSTRNGVQQTALGDYDQEGSSGDGVWHEYETDTRGGNSGGPIIINNAAGRTIGIHTNGGCTSSGGANAGTSFNHDPLISALQDILGPTAVYVDVGHVSGTENGQVFHPFSTIAEGITNVPTGGRVAVVSGTGAGPMTITKRLTLHALAGHVVIGD